MNYHIVIAEERRSTPRELALNIPYGVIDAEGEIIGTETQLHTMSTEINNIDSPQFVCVASWDGVSPIITVLKGSIGDLKMAYAGWPMIDVLPEE